MEKFKKSKSDLSKPNDLFFDMFENSKNGMLIIELETEKFQSVNASFLTCFGYYEEEILGKKSSEINILTPEFNEKIISYLKTHDSVNTIEVALKSKNGEQNWFLVSAQNIQIEEKKCLFYTFIDISKSKKSQEELELTYKKNADKKKQQNKIENQELKDDNASLKLTSQYSLSLIEAIRDPLLVISPEGKIIDTNEETANLTGVSKEKLIGSDFINYFTDKAKAKASYEEVFSKGFITNLLLIIKNSKATNVLFNGSIYKSEEGKAIGVVFAGRDITEQKQLETQLIKGKVFAELTTSITEEAKIAAENAIHNAEEVVKSKQQFLSNMSHEIRTPLNAIIGFTKVVLKTELTAKQREYLTAIKMSGDALIVLINDILDLAKVDAGKMIFEKKPFKLHLSIKSMILLFEPKAHEKNLELVCNYDKKIPEVLVGDPVRLQQIIVNLLSNSVKFTLKGKITVSVKLIDETDEKVTIKFSVEDTGIGIKESHTEKVFENFQQATAETSRIFGGTGLGLAIVKQLVEGQKGTIGVQSKLNKGSVFTFTLDFKKTDAQPIAEPEFLELNTDVKNVKILVVEDVELNQLLIKTLLEDFGFECEIASSGKIAIEKLEEMEFDAVLMDLQMPEMNGFEATQYIRNTMKLTIPIIALTADVTTVDLAKCKEIGMDDYISKPVDERILYSKLIGIIKKPVEIIPKSLNTKRVDGKFDTERSKITDLSYLLKITKSNPKLMSEIISTYLKQTPPLVQTMKQSFLDKDWSLLAATVHKMIPSFAIIGINPKIVETAHKIEEYAYRLEISNDLSKLITDIENVCAQAFVELELELINLNK